MHLYDDLVVEPAIETVTLSADGTTNGADHSAHLPATSSKFRQALCYIDVGTWTADGGTHTFKLQDAPDNGSGAAGTYADVPAARQVGPGTVVISDASNDNGQHYLGAMIGAGRPFVRVVATVTGNGTGTLADVEAHMILGDASPRPVR